MNVSNFQSELIYINSLLQKTQQNKDLTLFLFEKLFQELSEQTPELENALNAHKLEAAFRIAHKVNGAVSFCGFIELQNLSKCLEESLLAEDLAQAQEDFLRLNQAILHFQSLQDKIFEYFEENKL